MLIATVPGLQDVRPCWIRMCGHA